VKERNLHFGVVFLNKIKVLVISNFEAVGLNYMSHRKS